MKEYDVIIIGAGVMGAACAYMLTNYTSAKNVLVLEKETKAGAINSLVTNNSQTLHEGDIETNYSLKKAQEVQAQARYTRAYVKKKNNPKLSLKGPKMILGVGEQEVATLEKRYDDFKKTFPTLKKFYNKELAQKEPKIVEGRKPQTPLLALYNEDGLTINYGLLAQELIQDSTAKTHYQERVKKIKQTTTGYLVTTNKQTYKTKSLITAAGAHSLLYAKRLGYGLEYSLLLVAGNFYYTPKYLTAKTYTLQDPDLPFAAVHGDPDITNNDKNRYGPTTNIVFKLERRKPSTFFEFLQSVGLGYKLLRAYAKILLNKKFFLYAFEHNILYQIPYFGNRRFVRGARKIIPTLQYDELTFAKGQGGVRPQLVDLNKKGWPLNMGSACIEGEKALFIVTPSPGASISIASAITYTKKIVADIGETFNQEKLDKDYPQK